MTHNDYHEANRLSWNAATKQHNTHRGDMAKFLREGGSTLFPEEIELLGDIRGKSLVHLQCNGGLDTLSIAKHRGADVTGIDISDEAIATAQKLSTESGVQATLICSDMYEWFEQNSTLYDIVFTSYGAINWLSDIQEWGKGIASALKPGGRFVMLEFHPFMQTLDDDELSIKFNYSGGSPMKWDDGVGDYVAYASGEKTDTGQAIDNTEYFANPNPSYEFIWGTAEIIMALINAGLQLTFVHEYLYSNGFKPVPNMGELPGRRMVPAEGDPDVPLMLGLTAVKP